MPVLSVLKALDILFQFSSQSPALGVTDLSRRLQMPTSTVQRLLSTLVQRELVEQDPATQKFRLGPAILRLSDIALVTRDMRTLALPLMRQLRDETNEAVHLNVRRGDQRVLIERVEGTQELKTSTDLGQPSPLHCGASARVLLAYMPADAIERYVSGTLVSITHDSPVDPARLRSLLAEVREQGYAFSVSERIIGVASFSAPVWDHKGEVVASISLTMPEARYNPDGHAAHARRLVDIAYRLSDSLGYDTGTQRGKEAPQMS